MRRKGMANVNSCHMGSDDRCKKCLAISDKDGYQTTSHRLLSDDDCVELLNSDHCVTLKPTHAPATSKGTSVHCVSRKFKGKHDQDPQIGWLVDQIA